MSPTNRPHLDQLVVSGGGSASPATVNFPGAYKATDPGILINIHAAISSYVNPGPAVYAGGSSKVAGSACSAGGEGATTTGPPVIQTATGTPGGGGGGGVGDGCTVDKYAQCGGQDYTGCTVCAVSSPLQTRCLFLVPFCTSFLGGNLGLFALMRAPADEN
jgi:cellulase